MTKDEKIKREQNIVEEMILLYCRKNHRGITVPCEACRQLIEYAQKRSAKCPFMENKTFCSQCKVHCYGPEQRAQIRQVMRYAGPRMLFHHPVLALWHLISTKKNPT
ncbi:MAG: nitrous oxide-stimulated promoter family protein [Erysipelotrichaceae bacterium]|nr:nitrous oxide-stimulated promoter family protein [Erysipelotrichaceae bacterium]